MHSLTENRAIIPHVDDLGATHGANAAFLDLVSRGLVTCGSVMVPGPWFREIAEAAGTHQSLDIGVHLTLTSEWKAYRWAPISTVSPASGLIDADGYFWPDLESLRRHMVPEAAILEMRAQIERAIDAGMRPSHIDAHMAAAMLPELLGAHVQLGREYGVFPVLPRSIFWPPDITAYRESVAALDAERAPVIDHCRGTLAVDPAELENLWKDVLSELPPGVTHLALHCTAPGEIESIAAEHARWRIAEYELLSTNFLGRMSTAAGIALIGLRDAQRLWISYNQRSEH